MALTKLVVWLEVEGEQADALHVVDSLLENGFFQDAINDHEVDDAGPVHVRVAVVRPADGDCGAEYGRLTVSPTGA